MSCVSDVASKDYSVLMCAGKITALVMTGGGSSAVTASTTATKVSSLKQTFNAAKTLAEQTTELRKLINLYKITLVTAYSTSQHPNLNGSFKDYLDKTVGFKNEYVDDVFESAAVTMAVMSLGQELGHAALSILSMVAPTGIASVINGYLYVSSSPML